MNDDTNEIDAAISKEEAQQQQPQQSTASSSSSSSSIIVPPPPPPPPDHSETPFVCEIEATFPTNLQAEQALKVLQVDAEPTDRVTKAFRLKKETQSTNNNNNNNNDNNNNSGQEEEEEVVTLVIRFESKELKMLRVAVSSFYDYLNVVVKTMQEFDPTMYNKD